MRRGENHSRRRGSSSSSSRRSVSPGDCDAQATERVESWIFFGIVRAKCALPFPFESFLALPVLAVGPSPWAPLGSRQSHPATSPSHGSPPPRPSLLPPSRAVPRARFFPAGSGRCALRRSVVSPSLGSPRNTILC